MQSAPLRSQTVLLPSGQTQIVNPSVGESMKVPPSWSQELLKLALSGLLGRNSLASVLSPSPTMAMTARPITAAPRTIRRVTCCRSTVVSCRLLSPPKPRASIHRRYGDTEGCRDQPRNSAGVNRGTPGRGRVRCGTNGHRKRSTRSRAVTTGRRDRIDCRGRAIADVKDPFVNAIRIVRQRGLLPGITKRGLDLLRCRSRATREVERGRAGDVWRGHARPTEKPVRAPRPSGENAHAGGGDVDVGAEVTEARQRIIRFRMGRCPQAAGFPVGVGQGGDGDHLVVSRGYVFGRLIRFVSSSYHDRNASFHDPTDGGVERMTARAFAVRPIPAEAHVDDLDRLASGGNPVQPADDRGPGAIPIGVKHFDRPE